MQLMVQEGDVGLVMNKGATRAVENDGQNITRL